MTDSRESETESPWRFFPPERQKGRVFYSFFNRDDEGETDVTPVLSLLQDRFQAKILSMPFSPYNVHYEIAVQGIVISFVDDNWPCPYFSAPESDKQALEQLADELKRELRGLEIAL